MRFWRRQGPGPAPGPEPGADAVTARESVERGAMGEAIRESMEAAMDANVTGTPAWLLDGRLLIPGAQPRDLFEIWVGRMRERPEWDRRVVVVRLTAPRSTGPVTPASGVARPARPGAPVQQASAAPRGIPRAG